VPFSYLAFAGFSGYKWTPTRLWISLRGRVDLLCSALSRPACANIVARQNARGSRRGGQHLAARVASEIVLGFAVVAIAGLLGLMAPH
jgi:hypothetical protein